ncbi:MAG TPA: trigger factor [Patescibacteria group bacterium]|jgi:FKBP-type peptidyl-prolyl cis-trans isomerase (trigger factor)|nr:trigger factor [Patescibacteria group bacterium]
MKSILAKQDDGTIQLTITIPWGVVKKAKEEALEAYLASAQLPGFRKGKAPKKLVEKNINQDHLREETLRKLLPEGYVEALKEHALKPILNPKIHVEKLEDDKDWTFTAFTAEAPEIILGDYKDAVKKVTAKSKIIVPGKEPTQANFEDISKAILETATVKIPKIIIDQEVDRLLAQTLDEVKRLGLTLDQYLASTGRNTEALRQEYEKKAENDIKLEFLLQKIAEAEKITVEEKEIDEAITQAKTDAEKQNLQNNRYLLASIIRQQKTLDFLRQL